MKLANNGQKKEWWYLPTIKLSARVGLAEDGWMWLAAMCSHLHCSDLTSSPFLIMVASLAIVDAIIETRAITAK
jgi:hypothetical protein